MRHNLNSLTGFTLGATDGEIGTVKDFFFDDETWTIRYLVVETGSWLMGRTVLISTKSLLQPEWHNGIFKVNLTKEKVKHSPDIDTKMPVSRQEESKLHDYYIHTSYWTEGYSSGGMPVPTDGYYHDNPTEKKPLVKSHLRSSSKVTGYSIKATDGEIGKVDDFIIHGGTWQIDFMVVDTGNWLPGKKVLISPKWIKELDWENSAVTIHASMQQVKNSPEYNQAQPVSETHSVQLHNYYSQFITHIQ